MLKVQRRGTGPAGVANALPEETLRPRTPYGRLDRHEIQALTDDIEHELRRRAHWPIENSLHWVLDVSMDEDRARNRKGNGAACLAVIRRLALNIARMHPDKRSVRRKFLNAMWRNDFLLDMIRYIRNHE